MAGVGVVCTPGGSVWPRPGSVIAARSAASRRFMVAGDITTNAAATSSLTSRSVPSLGIFRESTRPARHLAQLIENDLLAGPVGPPIPRRDRLRHCLALAQRQPHPLRVSPARTRPAPTRRQRALLREATTPSTRASFVSQRAILTATGRIGRVAVLSKQPTRIGTAANVAGSREYRSPPGHHGDLPRGARHAHNPPARSA